MDGLSLSLHGAAVNHDLGVCHLRFLCTYGCGAGSWQLSLEARALDEDKGETRDGASTNQSFDVVGRAIVHAPQSQDAGPLTSSSHTALDAGALQCGQEYRLRVTARPLACDDSEYTGAGSGQGKGNGLSVLCLYRLLVLSAIYRLLYCVVYLYYRVQIGLCTSLCSCVPGSRVWYVVCTRRPGYL